MGKLAERAEQPLVIDERTVAELMGSIARREGEQHGASHADVEDYMDCSDCCP